MRLNKIETNHFLKPENVLFVFLRTLLVTLCYEEQQTKKCKKQYYLGPVLT
jgi:hypothetical protein